MNWGILSLPLVASLSLLLGTAGLYLTVKEALKVIDVPSVSRKEPDVATIKTAFSRVFPKTSDTGRKPVRTGADNLKVELLGTVVGARSMALLSVNGKSVIIREGEKKMGITLKRVYRKKAVIEVGGKELTLALKVSKPSPARAVSTSPRTIGEVKLSRREIERITKDPGIMFREIRLVPYVKNGKTEGFIFEWIKPGSLFYKAGLRKGDVLVSINNMTIRSGEDAFRLLQVLRNEPTLKVVVLRNGRRKEINIRIE